MHKRSTGKTPQSTAMKVVVGVVVVVILVGMVLGWALGANTVWRSFEALDQDDFGQLRKTPQQIHIAYGSSPSEMLITWSTYDNSEGDSGGGTAGTISNWVVRRCCMVRNRKRENKVLRA